MNFKNICILLGISITSIFYNACSDFLAEKPYSFIGPDQLGNDDNAIDQWVTGVYSKWANDMFRWDNFPRVLEMDCDYTTGPDWAFNNLGAGNFQGDEVSASIWIGCYNLINRANVAIAHIEKIDGATERHKNNSLGEMYFQKAFAYFMLTKAYGEIPLFDVAVSEGADYNQPRRPIPEVYGEITRLLEQAIPMLYKNTDREHQAGHVSAGTAAGLLSKVYATMASGALTAGEQIIVRTGSSYRMNGTEKVLTLPVSKSFPKTQVKGYESFDWRDSYTKAAQYAGGVMNGDYGSYELLPYDRLWKQTEINASEYMFGLRAVSGNEEYGSQIHRWFCGTYSAAGIVQSGLWIGNRFHWYSLFDHNDYRITKGVLNRWRYYYQVDDNYGYYYPKTPEFTLKATGYDSNGNKVADPVYPYNDGVTYIHNITNECLAFTNKYADVTDKTQARTDAYWPFLRFADVVLIYAEAQCELGSGVSSEAITALNEIRARSNAYLASTSGDGAITTKVALRSAIFEERAKELALEGDRRWDLIRWGIYLDVMNSIGGENADGAQTSFDEAGINKNRQSRHLLFPIPSAEISTNTAIETNNPGWS
ncbi:RagB/SusD family nutrient uptake outer membrane protein [Petrimonas sp.]|uniref:RagB/SusD family nutrient uptake outer membrane protein n=1 Tax=Petrimonas sp. TaxID=2023866 RepID=UPI003F5136ED